MLNQNTHSAPSNIAIIKYMGKTSAAQNLPTNPSISYTLEHLRSYVSLEAIEGETDQWQPLQGPGLLPMELSEKGRTKFLKHLARIKDIFGVKQSFLVKSANNFPSDCGIDRGRFIKRDVQDFAFRVWIIMSQFFLAMGRLGG
jgi:diphosphomevalonate decarboxylase